jgi:putative endonuclease
LAPLARLKATVSKLTGGRLWPEFHPRTAFMQPKDRLALRGEEMAMRELRRKGYEIIERGWRWHRFEIDLIARKENVLAVVEVKTRSSDRFGSPQEAVPRWKQLRIISAAKAFVQKRKMQDRLVRFDIISIVCDEKAEMRIEHIENAFGIMKS